tara:strand:+ start:1859 stop:2107 length:249 start_codon:yes stop_codon:yes gene_type:complete
MISSALSTCREVQRFVHCQKYDDQKGGGAGLRQYTAQWVSERADADSATDLRSMLSQGRSAIVRVPVHRDSSVALDQDQRSE